MSPSSPMTLSPGVLHEECACLWKQLTERLQTVPPWEWPEKITPWLMRLAGSTVKGDAPDPHEIVKYTALLALLNAIGRLHRARTGCYCDAFRSVRDELFRMIRQGISPQEVPELLDTVDLEGRSLEDTFQAGAA